MKKTTRRFALARETIKQLSGIELSGEELGRVAGGRSQDMPTQCGPTVQGCGGHTMI
jgi:hypothetical protein